MNQGTENYSLAALGRIVSLIKLFREEAGPVPQRGSYPQMSEYLKEHLSAKDWAFWQTLQMDWEVSHQEVNLSSAAS